MQRRWGVLFQQSALFTSLTVLENITFPLREYTQLDKKTQNELGLLKLLAVGLSIDAAIKYPAELSGGMLKRAALARALILDPELLLLDEPTAGLDSQGAAGFDQLLLDLRTIFGLTILLVTHDVDTLWQITDKVAFLSEGCVLECLPMSHTDTLFCSGHSSLFPRTPWTYYTKNLWGPLTWKLKLITP